MSAYFISHLGFHLWPTLLAIAILEGVIVHTWQFRKDASSRFLMYIQGGQLLWLAATLMAWQSRPVSLRIFWLGFLQIESLFTCTLWYQFVLEMSGYKRRLPRWPLQLMWGIVALFAVLLLTNPLHHSYWLPITGSPEEQQLHFGWIGNMETAAAYLILAVAMAVALCWYRNTAGTNRKLARLAISGGAICWAGHIATLFPGISFLAPLPLSFSLSALIIGWVSHRWRPFNIIPLAQEKAVDTMIDGLLIVDDDFYIIAMNPILQIFLSGLEVHAGMHSERLFQAWPELRQLNTLAEIEANRIVQGRVLYFKVSRLPLQTPSGKTLGMMFLFTDITLEKARRLQLLEQHEARARMAERATIGRELHDGTGQIWSFVSMQLETAQLQLSLQQCEAAQRTLQRTREAVQATHLDLRESITSLQTRLSGPHGLQCAIREQILWYQQQCGHVLELHDDPSWPDDALTPTARVHLLRIFQEVLANMRKYAQAKHVLIELSSAAQQLQIYIEDDGFGFDKEQIRKQPGHYGMQIMEERARLINALLEFDSAPQSGTKVRIAVPIPSAAMREEQ